MMAEKWGLDRTALDEFSLASSHEGRGCTDSGAFDDQIVAIQDDEGNVILGRRRHPSRKRPSTDGRLKPLSGGRRDSRRQLVADIRRLRGVAVHDRREGQTLGLRPIARVHTATLAGADPVMMLSAPIPATQKVLKNSGLSLDDIGVFEVNEAFAPVPMAWLKELGADEKKLNPNGGAIAIGHPLGGSGARIMTTLLYHMRDKGIRYGLQTMCEGGASQRHDPRTALMSGVPSAALAERHGHVLVITINRPEARNAVNGAVSTAVGDAVQQAQDDPEIRAVVLTGSGRSSFCAGADLKAIALRENLFHAQRPEWGFGGYVQHFIDKPTIAAVNGAALGGGTELALASDLVVAAQNAKFGLPRSSAA